MVRPANLITSATDIIAGATLATLLVGAGNESLPFGSFFLLLISTILLYAGGIAFNDVFDLELDRTERPERPLPSGRITRSKAIGFASSLLVLGILFAFGSNPLSGGLALSIAVFSLVYNKWSKHHGFVGPLNMGMLRGLNLLLGMSILPQAVYVHYLIALIPLIYIFAITMVSRGEVHGGSAGSLVIALGLFIIVDVAILSYGFRYEKVWFPIIFTFLHLIFVLPPLFKALKDPVPQHIRQTVKHGVLGVILVDAIWVSMTEYWYLAFGLLLLIPLSQKLARYFSVT